MPPYHAPQIEIPDTVGGLIDFLSKFPRDYKLDLFYADGSEWEEQAFYMKATALEHYRGLQLTVR